MKKLLLTLIVVMTLTGAFAQRKVTWSYTSEKVLDSQRIKEENYAQNQQLLKIDLANFKQSLSGAKDRFSHQPGLLVNFPNIAGEIETYEVWENSNFEPELQAKFPDIRAYVGKSLDHPGSTINFSLSPDGVQTMVMRPDTGTEFIEPYSKDHSVYILFDSATRLTNRLPFNCSTVDQKLSQDLTSNPAIANRSNNQLYKTMRLALSCTGEYGVYFGGTVAGATAGMNATMTRVNAIMEKDLAVHLNMIANNNLVVYTNAATDPYSACSTGANGAWNTELMNNLHNVLGDSAFDIGHLFGSCGGGGNAGCIGCVCSNVLSTGGTAEDSYKGSGYTSPSDNVPAGDTFDIDYVIHEMGHQLGANHTFSHNVEGTGVNVEPGSGSTIMGYAGITSYDVQAHSDAYYTYRSILQIQTNLATKTCPVSTTITNTPPSVLAKSDFSVPSNTPFVLVADVSDAEGDALTYCWEQNSTATSASSGANSVVSPTKTTGPNFRSFNPKSVPERYMPDMAKILAGTFNANWECLSTVTRASKFTLTVRDNNPAGSQTGTDEVIVTTKAAYNSTTAPTGAGPFTVTSQNTTGICWAQGSTQTITWDVNNTTSLTGSTNVNIKLSTDGGLTFPYILLADTANDGSEDITVPNIAASQTCRLKVEPTGNYYFAINAKNFYIGYEAVTSCDTYTYSTPYNIPDGATSYTSKAINVPTAGTISDVNITLNVTHPNLQNLTFAFLRPGGTLATLFTQQCSGSADMNVTFDAQGSAYVCGSPLTGNIIPPTNYNLNGLNGLNKIGNWQFGIKDNVAGNAGTVNSISLQICSQTFNLLSNNELAFQDLAVYPNPSNGNFTVEFQSKSNHKIGIEVFDIRGRKVYAQSFDNTGMFRQNIGLNNIQPGVYMVSIIDGDAKTVKKIVVE
jgi:subtilisin-like proprotein convertase family protein